MATMTEPNGIVTIMTDFGTVDGYVAAMKGALLSVFSQPILVDITHHVPTQDVTEAAFQLATVWRAFPRGTTHLAVVDPGVGSERRAICVEIEGHYFIAPDNGLLTLVIADTESGAAVVLDRPELYRDAVSSTFHGRDIFAPVAGHLAGGAVAFEELGSPIDLDSVVQLPWAPVIGENEQVCAPVVSIDRFGNCRTLVTRSLVPWDPETVFVRCGDVTVRGVYNTYSDVPEGRTLALFGSHGGLEIAVRNGSAAQSWNIERGDIVTISPKWIQPGSGAGPTG